MLEVRKEAARERLRKSSFHKQHAPAFLISPGVARVPLKLLRNRVQLGFGTGHRDARFQASDHAEHGQVAPLERVAGEFRRHAPTHLAGASRVFRRS
jgi:hypothetical protein